MYVNDEPPKMLPLRPIIRGPYSDNGDDDEHSTDTTIVYAEQHTEVKLNCEVDLDIAAVVWMHNGQVSGNFRFIVCFFTFTWIRPPPEHEIWYIFLTRQVAQIQANRVHRLFLFCLHKKKENSIYLTRFIKQLYHSTQMANNMIQRQDLGKGRWMLFHIWMLCVWFFVGLPFQNPPVLLSPS